jgi:UDP-glucose:(heptosyl)LPS alpha-1,3-glucosyltransferase
VRIALVQPKFDRSGGAERYAVGLAAGLLGRGHEVHLFARRAPEAPPGAVFHRVPAVPLGRALKTYSFWRLTQNLVRPAAFDVVQGFAKTTCQTVHRAGGGLHRSFLARGVHSRLRLYDRVVLRIEDALFASRAVRAIVVPGRWVSDEIARVYPAAAAKVRVIPNGVDVGAFSPEGREADRRWVTAELGIPEGCALLLFAATNFELKGLAAAVAALALLPSAHLVVVGGDDPDPFHSKAAALGSAGRLHFRGGRRDVARHYRAADVLVHPTRWDTFGNVCFEALACGTPVITTDRAGAGDLIGEGGVVLSYPVEAPALAAAVSAILGRGPEGREAARAVAVRNSVGAHVERMELLYREVVGEAAGDRRAARGER